VSWSRRCATSPLPFSTSRRVRRHPLGSRGIAVQQGDYPTHSGSHLELTLIEFWFFIGALQAEGAEVGDKLEGNVEMVSNQLACKMFYLFRCLSWTVSHRCAASPLPLSTSCRVRRLRLGSRGTAVRQEALRHFHFKYFFRLSSSFEILAEVEYVLHDLVHSERSEQFDAG
jgi:hypothetical protein